MSDDFGLNDTLVGLSCTSVINVESSWHLTFGEGVATLNLECPWRLVVKGSIAFGFEDHGQRFGLPAPVDGVKRTEKILASSPVSKVYLRIGTGDMTLDFENGAKLEAFSLSGGYEGWSMSSKDAMGFEIVALGGGRLEVFLDGAAKSISGLSSRY